MNTILDCVMEVETMRCAAIEQGLVKLIEEKLGRVPSYREVRDHVHSKIILPSRDQHFFWDDELLFICTGFKMVEAVDGTKRLEFKISKAAL